MLSLQNESIEAQRDAALFFRWIRQGVMTVEKAREEILVTDRQLKVIEADHDTNILRSVMRQRTETWNALVRLLAKEQGKSVARGASA